MHAFGEKRIESSVRIFALAQLTQRDRSLGQALEDKEVELSFFGEFDRGLNAIAGESRSRADSDLLHLCLQTNAASHIDTTFLYLA